MNLENINENTTSLNNINKNEYTTLSFILLAFIFLFQYSSKTEEIKNNMILSNDLSKKKQINIANYIFWKYLILFQLTNGIHVLLSSNIENGTLHIYSFIISTIFCFLFLIIYKDKITYKNKGILFYGIFLLLLSFYSILISINLINSDINLFQLFIKISNIIRNVIFINNFEEDCHILINDIQIKNNLINNFIEKNELISIFIKIVFQYVLLNINNINNNYYKKYNIKSPSNSLSLLLSLFIVLIYLFWNKKEDNNTNNKIEQIYNSDNYNKILILGITELFINIIYSLYKSKIIEIIKERKPEMNNYYIYNLFIPSFLAGITSFRILFSFYNSNVSKIAKINSIILILGIIMLQLYYDFNKILYGMLLIEASFGLYSVLYKRIVIYVLKNHFIGKKIIIWFFLEIIKIIGNDLTLKYNIYIYSPLIVCLFLSIIIFLIIYLTLDNIIINNNEINIMENSNKSNIKKSIKKD
jgi:hypothetical protein